MLNEERITHEVRQVTLSIQEHEEKIDLDVFGLATHDIILGLPWLREHNPRIDWKSKVFQFECCGTDAPASQPTHRQSSMVDESNIAKQCNIAERKANSTKTSSQCRKVDSADTETRPTDHEARVQENSATPEIPEPYKEYEHLF